jgi:UDP-N-acetylmuramate--alanine ligase
LELDTSQSSYEKVSGSSSKTNTSMKPEFRQINGPVHFIGVGGIGMSALAKLLLLQGMRVSGSDRAGGPLIEDLKNLGADIFVGHKAENVGKAEAVVVSTAITRENPELARALERRLPVYHRSEVLSHLTSEKKLVAVSGTHGKTTTTGMIAQILLDCAQDPSVVVGGIFAYMSSNSRLGKGDCFVAEADESDQTHAGLPSEVAVVTNIEPDHMENYPGGMSEILSTMAAFANKARKCVVLCQDDAGCLQLLPLLERPVVTYGWQESSPAANYTMRRENVSGSVRVYKNGNELGALSMSVPGAHNLTNALAAIAVGMEMGLSFSEIAASLSRFAGVARRFEHVGESHDVLVVDDYGHHPTEVRATLEAAQQFRKNRDGNRNGRIVAVFQPHQPGRLRDLWNEFIEAFHNADLLLLTDIYVARGGPIEGISSERFSREVKHGNVYYLNGPVFELAPKIKAYLQPGDIVLTIGAGDITGVGRTLLELIRAEGLDGRSS